MNCPSRTDEPDGTGMNQSPDALAADLTTREDLNGRANARALRRCVSGEVEVEREIEDGESSGAGAGKGREGGVGGGGKGGREGMGMGLRRVFARCKEAVKKFGAFVGPGMLVCEIFVWKLSIVEIKRRGGVMKRREEGRKRRRLLTDILRSPSPTSIRVTTPRTWPPARRTASNCSLSC